MTGVWGSCHRVRFVDQAEKFEIAGEYASFSPEGRMSLEEAVGLVSHAIARCYDQKIARLLIDATRLTGFPPPTIFERYEFVHEWAREARGVAVAMIARPEHIDPEKFGVTVAHNAGLRCDVFTGGSEALAFLLVQTSCF